MTVDLSVIMPVINEQAQIRPAVERLRRQSFSGNLEIIVVDGDPCGSTISCLPETAAIRMTASPGRGSQMNAGARQASGRILLFLHCDTRLPQGGLDSILSLMAAPGIDAGAFDLAIDHPGTRYRIIERTASFRSRLTRIPYGDQAVFIRAAFFNRVGRYREIPIMEDVELMRRIKKEKGRIHIFNESVKTSARRWEKEGLVFCTVRNWFLVLLFLWGVSPEKLSRFYKIPS